eukprot:Skav203922  [mRNA]  locus=scaffold228:425739:427072:- [translate_table: standard]
MHCAAHDRFTDILAPSPVSEASSCSKSSSSSSTAKEKSLSEDGDRACSTPCIRPALLAIGTMILGQVALLGWSLVPIEDAEDATFFGPRTTMLTNQVLAAAHCFCAVGFCFIWWQRSHVPLLLWELLLYIISSWSFWLLGAAFSLGYLHQVHKAIQVAAAWPVTSRLW